MSHGGKRYHCPHAITEMDLVIVFHFVGEEHHCTEVLVLDVSANASTCALCSLESDSLKVHKWKIFYDTPLGFMGSSEVKGLTSTLQ